MRIALLAAGLGGLNIAAPGAGAIVTIFIAGLAIGAAVIVWISLLIRKALRLIAIVFAPVALAGSSWDQTRGWVRKWAQFVVALIVSKVVLVVIFLLATAQVSAPIDADLQSVSEPIAGVVLMLMARFAPYLSYRAISFMGFDTYHAISAEQEAKSALNRPMPIPMSRRPGSQPSQVLQSGGSGVGGASGSGGGAPTPAATPSGAGGVGMSGASPSGASSGGGGGAAGVNGAVAAGVVLAKEAVSAGVRTGRFLGAAASQHTDAANSALPPTSDNATPAQLADSSPAQTTFHLVVRHVNRSLDTLR